MSGMHPNCYTFSSPLTVLICIFLRKLAFFPCDDWPSLCLLWWTLSLDRDFRVYFIFIQCWRLHPGVPLHYKASAHCYQCKSLLFWVSSISYILAFCQIVRYMLYYFLLFCMISFCFINSLFAFSVWIISFVCISLRVNLWRQHKNQLSGRSII